MTDIPISEGDSGSDEQLAQELLRILDKAEKLLKRRAFDEPFPECDTALGKRLAAILTEMSTTIRDHSLKMIALVEALAGANRLYSEKIEELSSMRRVGDALSSTLDVGETCRLATDVLVEEAGAEASYLFLVDENTKRPVLRAAKQSFDTPAIFFAKGESDVDPTILDMAVKAIELGEPVVSGVDDSLDLPTPGKQTVCLPLLASAQPIGAIALVGSSETGLRPYAGRILGILSNQIAAALVHSHLYAKLAIAQKVQTIVETAVAVNHQINNPLSVVLMSVSMLRREIEDGSSPSPTARLGEIEQAVYEVQNAVEKLATIVDPVVEEYADGIKMISLEASDSSSSVSQEEFLESYRALLEQMRLDAEEKAGYEAARTDAIAHISKILGKRLGLSQMELEDLEMLCLWHDIGIEAIDEKILRKPCELEQHEIEDIREHPEISEQLLRPVHGHRRFIKLIRHHHEDVNGDGYPDKLPSSKLPLSVRIHRVVEAYVAMRSDRPFRSAMHAEEAQKELVRCAGLQFDPSIVSQFLTLLRELPDIDVICSSRDCNGTDED